MQEEHVDYVMHSPFVDALPTGVYSNSALGSLQVKTRDAKQCNDGLFADDIWPGAVFLSDYLCSQPELIKHKRVLELGAGAALPSLVSCRLDAAFVLITDFPQEEILENIRMMLVKNNITSASKVMGHCWGDDVSQMLSAGTCLENEQCQYDVILMAELLWKDTYSLHDKLLESVFHCLQPGGMALVSFAKRPDPAVEVPHNDDVLFTIASKMGFSVTQLASKDMNDVCSCELVSVTLTMLKKII